MEVIVVLIGAALLVAGGFLVAFLWAVRSGQYDDIHTPSIRMLHDDAPAAPNHDNNHDRPAETP
jgi:cbb3-type cytochrome oxidase maturation protein